ncbi:MAG: tyrosyl-tRNA synthetase [Sclerophora amabilis]|nr:MAG: tyrosyl-tRNA synthetase [Sclerophora amabilis]
MWRPGSYVCWRCARRSLVPRDSPRVPSVIPTRSISQNFLRKSAEWEKDWQAKAVEIRAGRQKSMLSILEERGLVDTVVGDRDALDRLMTDKRVGAYVGIDPTAPSLHVGHLLPLMALYWLFISGYRSVSLLGGATSKIGDPTDRLKPRDSQTPDIRKANMVSMHYQIKKIWMNVEVHVRRFGYQWHSSWRRELVNNNEWLNKLPITEWLQIVGKVVRLGPMLGRDTVRNRLEKGEGMSFAEFTYPIIQAWDWWYIYETKRVQIQIGGSDQFGNIVAGVDALKTIKKTHPDPRSREEKEDPLMTPYGLTVPLLTNASGEKFGKTMGNAIWLDPEMTSSFELYQFFLRTADAEAERYLKLFTFLGLPEIESILKEHDKDRSKRKAQHTLAREVLALLHGETAAREAEMQHRGLFGASPGSTDDHNSPDAKQTPSLVPKPWQSTPDLNITLPKSLVINQPFPRVLHSAGLVQSRSEGHRLCNKQGAYVGSRPGQVGGMGDSLKFTPIKLWDAKHTKEYLLEGNMMVLRIGKWKVKIVRLINDDEFDRLGLDAPGWHEEKERIKNRALGDVTDGNGHHATEKSNVRTG